MAPTKTLDDALRRYDVESTKQLRSLVVLSIKECCEGVPTLLPLATYNRLRQYKEPLTGKVYMKYLDILHGIGVVDKDEEVWMPHIKPKFYTNDSC